jgi:hypothetical protein
MEPQMTTSNPLFRLLAVNAASGALLGVGFVGCLLALDTANLRRLIAADPEGLVALALLTLGFVITCSSVMMGSAIMRSRKDDGDDDRRGSGGVPMRPAYARQRARR